jgi:hypothetical protein
MNPTAPTLEVSIYLGKKPWGPPVAKTIPQWLLSLGQDLMSEHEVLDMGGHDIFYALEKPTRLPPLARGATLPRGFKRQTHRSLSKDVIGNLGEGIGIAAFMHLTGIHPRNIIRARRSRQYDRAGQGRRMPDFVGSLPAGQGLKRVLKLLEDRHLSPAQQQSIEALLQGFPDRFPIEAKASSNRTQPDYWGGLWQLVEYWHTVHKLSADSASVGHGILLRTARIGRHDRRLRIHIFSPTSGSPLISKISGDLPPQRKGSAADFEAHFGQEDCFVEG